MKRVLSATTVLLALALVACGGGDSDAPAARGDDAPLATRTPRPEAPKATATSVLHPITTPSPDGVRSSSGGFGGGLASLLNTALGASSGGPSLSGFGGGDADLEQYLLDDSDLPAGYSSFVEFSFRAPDGISATGGADISASLAMQGDPADATDIAMLMSMVMRFDDLQDLESMFGEAGELDPEALQQAIDDAGAGAAIRNVAMLDASGLGDNAFGMTMTIDLGGFVSGFGGDAGDLGGLDSMTIRMYFFGRGKYAGALLRMGTGDTLGGDVDELALARVLDAKLRSAP